MQGVLETPAASDEVQVTRELIKYHRWQTVQCSLRGPEAPAAVVCEIREGCWGCSDSQTAAACRQWPQQVAKEFMKDVFPKHEERAGCPQHDCSG